METPSLEHYLAGFLTDRCGLHGEARRICGETIRRLLEALRDGHSCLQVSGQERSVVAASTLVSDGEPAPLVLCGTRLYLHRVYQQEVQLADRLRELAAAPLEEPGGVELLDRFFPAGDDGPDWQREAARTAISGRLTIIAGGPGTGKTTTVARIVGLLLAGSGPRYSVVLAAPTGKAAIRLIEALRRQMVHLPLSDEELRRFPETAHTVHRLLGLHRFAGTARYSRDNPLPADAVVVDEASMVDLALMSRLAEALAPGSRLILLGDKDQLASVESGAVLSDCIVGLPQRVVELRRSWRFNRAIARFAVAVNDGEAEQAWRLLNDSDGEVVGAPADWRERVGARYRRFMDAAVDAAAPPDYAGLFAAFNRFRVLTALRHGPWGAAGINDWVEWYLARQGYPLVGRRWYPGRPVLITRNDYSLGLANGDIGLCLPDPHHQGELAVWFEQPGDVVRRLAPTQLPACETAWAMTIHKSQGSEFDEVTVVLPDSTNQILCRELLYTAVTRARERVELVADREALRAAVLKRTRRCSGLVARLQNRETEETP